jgi:hypothetical protein
MQVVTVEHALYGSCVQLPASAAQKGGASNPVVVAPVNAHELHVALSETQPLSTTLLPLELAPPELLPLLEAVPLLEPLLVAPELLPLLDALPSSSGVVAGAGLLLLLQATTRAAADAITTPVAVNWRSKWFVLITAPHRSRSGMCRWNMD